MAALQFARSERIIPAPEPAHAIRAAIEEAEAAREAGEERVILCACSATATSACPPTTPACQGPLEDPEFSEADRDAAWRSCRRYAGDRLAIDAAAYPGLP